MKLKLTLAAVMAVSMMAVVSAQAGTVAIKDMTLVQESGSIASVAGNQDFHHHHHHHHHHHFHGHHGHHFSAKASAAKSELPAPRIGG